MGSKIPRRAIRIGACSGAKGDPAIHMLNQAKSGCVDAIFGDYLAEFNLAEHAQAKAAGTHEGYELEALKALSISIEEIASRGLKVVINGGALNPQGLARKIWKEISSKGLKLTVGYVQGDDFMDQAEAWLRQQSMPHLDSVNEEVEYAPHTFDFLDDPQKPIISANAYLGSRAIVKGLEKGADIIICGRTADAAPVIGLSQWWHGWADTDFNQLAGALTAGHLVECSTYTTGGNFAGFDKYDLDDLIDLDLPIAEIDSTGGCIITKAPQFRGIVTDDVVKCQLLYELQGDIYLNSVVKADLRDIVVQDLGDSRVAVSGVYGLSPPPTTKLAIFYVGGYQSEMSFAATGYATARKWDLLESQFRHWLKKNQLIDKLETIEFQRHGLPMENPTSQLASTTTMRIFSQAVKKETLLGVLQCFQQFGMQHYSGMHFSLDFRAAIPRPYHGYFPALLPQESIKEEFVLVDSSSKEGVESVFSVGVPPKMEPLEPRRSYDADNATALDTFGPSEMRPLGDIALARSGDKGGNINIGIFVSGEEEWQWLRSFLSMEQMKKLIGNDWRDWYSIERVEFPKIQAVHFVIYGILDRGVTSTSKLDCLGKGFADYIRARHVPVPTMLNLR